jgi:hypothetical protein
MRATVSPRMPRNPAHRAAFPGASPKWVIRERSAVWLRGTAVTAGAYLISTGVKRLGRRARPTHVEPLVRTAGRHYLGLQLAYCVSLKHLLAVDLAVVTAGFLMRCSPSAPPDICASSGSRPPGSPSCATFGLAVADW